MKRFHVNFLHHILQQDDSSLLHRMLTEHCSGPRRRNWSGEIGYPTFLELSQKMSVRLTTEGTFFGTPCRRNFNILSQQIQYNIYCNLMINHALINTHTHWLEPRPRMVNWRLGWRRKLRGHISRTLLIQVGLKEQKGDADKTKYL